MILGQTDIPSEGFPGTSPEQPPVVSPGPTTTTTTSDEEQTHAARVETVKALAIFGGIILAAGALVFFTREPGSRRERRAIRPGRVFCKWGVRYRMNARGRLMRIGNC